MEAKYYQKLHDRSVQCELCPHQCIISEGRQGKCRVRTNAKGTLQADNYQAIASVHLDPVEKKPLYHFYPGREVLSLGTVGCNFKCSCCQNFEISQVGVDGFAHFLSYSFDQLVQMAQDKPGNLGIAYTYNEPAVWFEFITQLAPRIQAVGLKNILVSNGYIMPKPLEELLACADAFNIDLKVFDEGIHHSFTGGELAYVKHTLKRIVAAERHLEITHLVIPGINDRMENFQAMIQWIGDSLGDTVPLHLSRYFPRYKAKNETTPVDLLLEMAEYARRYLKFVYVGNAVLDSFQDTYCPGCGTLVIQRSGYRIQLEQLSTRGTCLHCGHQIAVCS